MVSDEETEVQIGREMPRTRHGLEDDLECVLTDNYVNSGPIAGRGVE